MYLRLSKNSIRGVIPNSISSEMPCSSAEMAGHGVCSVATRMVMATAILGLALCLGSFPVRAGAWGADGHHATCLLAEVNACPHFCNFDFALEIRL